MSLKKKEISEIFVPIKDYEDRYLVSNTGKIFSIKRQIFLKPVIERNYYRVQLFNGKKFKHFHIHRIVANTFLSNPYNLPEVNHKDEDKLNNNVSNLEWCTKTYNINYGTCIHRSLCKRSKQVEQYDKSNNLIDSYLSIMDAERVTKIPNANINACCKGKRNTAGGYIWRYVEEKKE